MKNIILSLAIVIVLLGCKKNGFDVNKPDVDLFVSQLKNGTYNEYETDEKGKQLWLKMPRFEQQHIARLIELSKDTTHIEKFPTNPVSSRRPFPEGRNYFIVGECLLSIVHGIRGEYSLDPYLVDTSKEVNERYKGITTTEVLIISDKYKQWWNNYKNGDWKANSPLANTPYKWM